MASASPFRLLLLLLFCALPLTAQPPLPLVSWVGGPNPTACASGACRTNSVLFSSAFGTEYRAQFRYPASALSGGPVVLTDISFVLDQTGVLLYNDCVISVGHAIPGPMSCTFASNAVSLIQQYAGPLAFGHTADQWSSLGLPLAFTYDGVSDLVIEVQLRGYVSGAGGVAYMAEPSDSASRVYSSGPGAYTSTVCTSGLPDPVAPKTQLVFQSVQATATPVGLGCGLLVPTLTASSPPSIGNALFSLDIAGAAAGQPTYLFLAFVPATAPLPLGGGCNVYLDLNNVAQLITLGLNPIGPIPTDSFGNASFPLPVPADITLRGATISAQALIDDPINPLGLALTNGIELLLN